MRASNEAPVPLGTKVPCAVCGADVGIQRDSFEKDRLIYTECAICGLEMINPRPVPEWIEARYAWLAEAYFLQSEKIESDFDDSRFEEEFDILRGITGKLLDVGCNNGPFVRLAGTRGFEAIGIDIMDDAVRYGRERHGLNLICGDFTGGGIEKESFDVVTMWATLEHLSDPSRFVEEAWRVLRPNGYLAVSVPNRRDLARRVLGTRYRYVTVEHLNGFDSRALAYLVSRRGFVPTKMCTRGLNPLVLIRDMVGANGQHNDPDMLLRDQLATNKVKMSAGLIPLRVAHRWAERAVARGGLGSALFCLARKP